MISDEIKSTGLKEILEELIVEQSKAFGCILEKLLNNVSFEFKSL